MYPSLLICMVRSTLYTLIWYVESPLKCSLFRTCLYVVLCFRFLIRRVLEVIVGTNIALALIQQWIIPSVVNSLIPFSVTDVTSKTAESIEHRTFFRFRVKVQKLPQTLSVLFFFLNVAYLKGHNAAKWSTQKSAAIHDMRIILSLYAPLCRDWSTERLRSDS